MSSPPWNLTKLYRNPEDGGGVGADGRLEGEGHNMEEELKGSLVVGVRVRVRDLK